MQYVRNVIFGALITGLAACSDAPTPLQGYIEGDFLAIGALQGGRVTALNVREGALVNKGDLLFALDDTDARTTLAASTSALTAAQARLRDAQSGARQEEIEALSARRQQAEASLELSRIQYVRQERLVATGTRPPEMLDEARASLALDQAKLDEIAKDIEVARLGARINQIEVAIQDVEAAKADLEKAQWSFDERSVKAPIMGQISEVIARPGEVVAAGAPVVLLLPPGNIKARFFLPQASLAQMTQGSEVVISCDGCPETVAARITFVANEVEFTPPVIYSDDARDKLVVMAEARPATPVDFLRPGQPVTVTPVR